MRVVLAPVGSRGDVQPMIALARALKAAGHSPFFSITQDFKDVVTREGFEFQALKLDAQAVATEMGSGVHNPVKLLRKVAELIRSVEDEAFRAADGADVVVGAGLQVLASSVSQARKVPYVFAAYCPPMLRSRQHSPVTVPWQGLPSWANAALWGLTTTALNLGMRDVVNGPRARLQLPPVPDVWDCLVTHQHVLGAFDDVLAAPLADGGARLRTCGYFFLDDPSPLPAEVEAFLQAGPPPVYIGFGSMPHTRPQELSNLVLDAVARAKVRVVLGAGWAGLGTFGPVPDNVLVVKSVNHSALFGRTAGVVHHGGAGTTSTAARVGVAQLVVPHLMDQFYWGHRVHACGLGPAPIPIKRLRAGNLAAALETLTTQPSFRVTAEKVARGMNADGPARAVKELEDIAAGGV